MATGTSFGCSDLIGPLLLTELRLSSRSLLELPDLNMLEDEDAHFFFLNGSGVKNNDTRVWISKKDYSIRRVEQDSYSLKTEREARQQEFRAREERLSAILHREIQSVKDTDSDEDVHLLHDYKFATVEFDIKIDPTVFELKPRNET